MRVRNYGHAQTTVIHKYKTWQIELYSTYKDFIICKDLDNLINIVVKHIVPQKRGKIDSSIKPFTMMKVSGNKYLIVYSKYGLAIIKIEDLLEKKRISVKAKVYSAKEDLEIPDEYWSVQIGDLIIVDKSVIAVGVNCYSLVPGPKRDIASHVVFINTENGFIWRTERLNDAVIIKLALRKADTVLAICDNEYSWEEDFKDGSAVFHKIPTIYAIKYENGAITGKLAQSVEPAQ